MSTIPSVTDTGLTAAAAGSSNGSSAADVQNRFLQLLVTQMRNQDPLNPLDNAEVTTQLAQLNTVTGISQLNDTMQGLAASFAASQVLQSGALLGRDVMLQGSQLSLSGGQAFFGAQLAQPVDHLVVQIVDAAGNVAHRVDTGPQQAGVIALQWDGALDSGGLAPDGAYTFQLSASAGGKAADATGLSIAKVLSVSTAGGVKLNLSTGASAALGDILQII